MTADPGRFTEPSQRMFAVVVGFTAVLLFTFPLSPGGMSAAAWAVVWAGAAVWAVTAVRIWRSAAPAGAPRTPASQLRGHAASFRSFALLAGATAAVWWVLMRTYGPRLPIPWAWVGTPLMAAASVEFCVVAHLMRVAADREERRER